MGSGFLFLGSEGQGRASAPRLPSKQRRPWGDRQQGLRPQPVPLLLPLGVLRRSLGFTHPGIGVLGQSAAWVWPSAHRVGQGKCHGTMDPFLARKHTEALCGGSAVGEQRPGSSWLDCPPPP